MTFARVPPAQRAAATVGLSIVAAKVVLSLPRLEAEAAQVAITWFVVAAYVVVGLALFATDLPRSNGWACLSVAAATLPGDMNNAAFAGSYLTPVGYVLEPLYLPVTTALVLRYPRAAVRAPERMIVVGLAVTAVLGRVLAAVSVGRLPDGFRRPVGWPTLPLPWWWHDVIAIQIDRGSVAVLLLILGVLIARRPLRASGLARRSLAPLATIGFLCGSAAAADQAMWALDLTSLGWPVPSLVRNLTAAAIPIALLADLLRRRAASAAISEKVLMAARSGNAAALQHALQETLVDPTVVVWIHAAAGWHPTEGNAPEPIAAADQVLHAVSRDDGTQVAAVAVRTHAEDDDSLLQTALVAVRIGVENTQLHADLLARMAELQESRARIVEAGLTERRRVERDLHDGAQQRFLAVASTLARSDLVDDAQIRDVVSDARTALAAALRELRELARGIHPAVLSQGGLAAALGSLTTDRSSADVVIDVDADLGLRRPAATTESAIYFVTAEALTNAVKHARASTIRVRVDRDADAVRAVIEDDGSGGAWLVGGGGLAGLRDRVEALGGTFQVHSDPCDQHPHQHGTMLVAVITEGTVR